MRRTKPQKRPVKPDVRYNSRTVSMFVNRMMRDGKKSVAYTIIYDAFSLMEERMKRNPLEVFEEALQNVSPAVEVKARRVGGSTYQVPIEVPLARQKTLAMRWIIAAARARKGRSMAEKLAGELMDAANNTGVAIKRREDTHRMAEANRAFSHYRF